MIQKWGEHPFVLRIGPPANIHVSFFLGQVLCCKWDGCNRDLRSANTTSKEYELRLMKAGLLWILQRLTG